jgi:hypothetical protein
MEHSPEVWHIPPGTLCIYIYIYIYTGLGKSRFTDVRMEKDMQVMIIMTALLIT